METGLAVRQGDDGPRLSRIRHAGILVCAAPHAVYGLGTPMAAYFRFDVP